MARRTRRFWALVLAAAMGLAGAVADGRGSGLPKKPGPPKPVGTPKSPVKLPAIALWQAVVAATSRA
ncbi:MAG TPA: hypothetical protein VGK67_41130 [Myxococcales bacterium]